MHIYPSASASRAAGITYHLVPASIWAEQKDADSYLPEAYPQDGFIHCTNGLDELVKVANMFYTADPRPFLTLILEVDKIASEVRYDDPNETYPHIYGPLNADAVVGELAVTRADDGTFLSIGPA
ncbi:MAG: DUF952 domain-containing protein [Thermomicrobiales bacterium]